MSNPIRVRCALAGIFALLVLALVIPSVAAQVPPRQDIPVIAPRPKPRPSPADRFGELPPVTTMPVIPDPRTPAGRDTGRSVYPGKTTVTESAWVCDKCKKTVGNGLFPPQKCPHCGVTFSNGSVLGTGVAPTPKPPAYTAPGKADASGPTDSETEPPEAKSTIAQPTPAAPVAEATPSTGRTVVITAGIVTGIIVLIVFAILILMLIPRGAKKPLPRKIPVLRARRVDDGSAE